jgi:uncharacterized phage protein (TIGR01671 family)
MRKIIFRAKPKAGHVYKEWLYGSLIQIDEQDYGIIELNDISCDENGYIDYAHTHVQSETIGQFTGLLDKNGKEIYEGDVVQRTVNVRNYAECDGVVEEVYAVNYCASGWLPFIEITDDMTEYEIIGNIHDNPELLIK